MRCSRRRGFRVNDNTEGTCYARKFSADKCDRRRVRHDPGRKWTACQPGQIQQAS